MCCKDEMHGRHASHMAQIIPHEPSDKEKCDCGCGEPSDKGMCGCGCGGRKFLSKREQIEKLEEYSKMLKSELEGVEEKLKEIKGT
ncbi:MAG: hypothetical protein A4E49_02613 [Methanosaeta sp. PtaU1.Bin112]|nr:MAG: hypothetical protein A4E49_02613 [Methanosaeta sp. PtaU1.Bin112]